MQREGEKTPSMDLFVVAHKEFEMWADDRVVISVGGAEISFAQVKDSVADNISEKNGSYCELTALYWIWKNCRSEYVGLEHYRRYFLMHNQPISKRQALKILKKRDLIVSDKYYTKPTLYEQYDKAHVGSDLDCIREIVREKYPDYLPSLEAVYQSHGAYYFNMFIARKTLLDDYCSWLFPILFELETKIDNSARNSYQARTFGFVAERLFNVYILKNKLKVKSMGVYGSYRGPIVRRIHNFIGRIRYH